MKRHSQENSKHNHSGTCQHTHFHRPHTHILPAHTLTHQSVHTWKGKQQYKQRIRQIHETRTRQLRFVFAEKGGGKTGVGREKSGKPGRGLLMMAGGCPSTKLTLHLPLAAAGSVFLRRKLIFPPIHFPVYLCRPVFFRPFGFSPFFCGVQGCGRTR